MRRKPENCFGVKRPTPVSRGVLRDGFTLIELLVAIALLMVITGIVYSSFSTVATSIEDTRLASAELQLRQYLTQSFTSNLSQISEDWLPGAAYRDAQTHGDEVEDADDGAVVVDSPTETPGDPFGEQVDGRSWFEGVNEEGEFGPADRLRFVTAAGVIGPEALPGITKEVTYEVQDNSKNSGAAQTYDEDGQLQLAFPTLFVTETPLMEEPSNSGLYGDSRTGGREGFGLQNPSNQAQPSPGDRRRPTYGRTAREENRINGDGSYPADESGQSQVAPGWRVPIRSMELRYFDGEDWLDDWSSQEMGRLPWSVDIRINFARPEEELAEEEFAGYDFLEDPDLHLVVAIPAGVGVLDERPDYVRTQERGFEDRAVNAIEAE